MCKTDIEDAYKLIPIKPEEYAKLGLAFDGKFYYDRTLPQGCASSCKIFETFSSALQDIFMHYEPAAGCQHMIDDFLFIGNDEAMCEHYLTTFKNVCADIGVPLAPHKTTTPSTITTFLGIELNSSNQTASLPLEKIEEYSECVSNVLSKTSIKYKELESLIGKLNFAASVVPARAFLRRLIDLLHAGHTPPPVHNP